MGYRARNGKKQACQNLAARDECMMLEDIF
jgi:hypothetical protein